MKEISGEGIDKGQGNYDLRNFTIRDLTECGQNLRRMGEGTKSMEEVGKKVVGYLYDNLIDGQSGERACALVRFFKTHDYGDLDDELKSFALNMLGRPPHPGLKCLVLLATTGEKEEWKSRADSEGHKAIPLPSEKALDQIPMIKYLVKQWGLRGSTVIKPDPDLLLDMTTKNYKVFFVPDALGSQYIPAQTNFVVPFGIQSIVGFGGVLPSGNIFSVITFLKIRISKEVADLFGTLSLNVKIAVLPFENSIFA